MPHTLSPNANPTNPLVLARAVHHAVAVLRRGGAVLLRATPPLLLVAAETMTDEGQATVETLGAGPARLLLTSLRADAILQRPAASRTTGRTEPVAIWLQPEQRQGHVLRSLADPTADQVMGEWTLAPTPDGAAAALALAKLARLLPAMLAVAAAESAADLGAVTPDEVSGYAQTVATNLVRVSEARVPLEDARDARVVAFRPPDGGPEHLAILIGNPEAVAADASPDAPAPLARIHSECFTGDVLGSLRCDCGPQLRDAIRRMAQEGNGVLLYLAQEGRGIGLANKLRAYTLQDRGLDTLDANRALGWEADERSFLTAATMLRALGIPRVRLLTNNPDKVASLAAYGIAVERHSLLVAANGINDTYLATKASRFGHFTT